LAVRAKRDVESGLKKKGFRQDEGDHHWFLYWTADGKKTTIRTKTSHGTTKDLGDGLLKEMARQVRLPKAQFLELIDCPLTQQHYQKLLEDGEYI
jgi:predicted RNA binding protein YcfA (HicA-like mRNA interferase family)